MPTTPLRRYEPEAGTFKVLAFLTPDRVLDISYCMYVVICESEQGRDTADHRLAQDIINDFLSLCEKHKDLETPEGQFLFCISQIVVSLARGINRRKNAYLNQLAAAGENKERQTRNITGNAVKTAFLRACWRILLLGGVGYSLARTLLPGLHIGESQPPTIASLAMAGATILIGSFIKSRWTGFQFNSIFTAYHAALFKAEQTYNQGVKDEYGRAKEDAARFWKKYTGEEPQVWIAFDAILAGNLARHDPSERKLIGLWREALALFGPFRFVRRWQRWRARRGNGASNKAD